MMNNGLKKMRQSDIDAHLKRAFQELTDEGLPDRFTDLLSQLRQRDGGDDIPANGSGLGNGGSANAATNSGKQVSGDDGDKVELVNECVAPDGDDPGKPSGGKPEARQKK